MNWVSSYRVAVDVVRHSGQEYQEAIADGKLMLTEVLRGLADVIEQTGNDRCVREVDPAAMSSDTPTKVFAAGNMLIPTITGLYMLCQD